MTRESVRVARVVRGVVRWREGRESDRVNHDEPKHEYPEGGPWNRDGTDLRAGAVQYRRCLHTNLR